MPIYCGHCQKKFDRSHPLSLEECADKIGDKRAKPAKRYQVVEKHSSAPLVQPFTVMDTWTNLSQGRYFKLAKAQARARLLNSRQGA